MEHFETQFENSSEVSAIVISGVVPVSLRPLSRINAAAAEIAATATKIHTGISTRFILSC